jgi:hypothetical protein
MVSNQLESLNVMSPPVPGSLPPIALVNSKNSGALMVTVWESSDDSPM